MGYRRNRPKLLPKKFLAIREFLKLDKVQMASTLESEILSHSGKHCGTERRHYQIRSAHISEYERGKPDLDFFVVAAYARLARVTMESVVDDVVTVTDFRKRLVSASQSTVDDELSVQPFRKRLGRLKHGKKVDQQKEKRLKT